MLKFVYYYLRSMRLYYGFVTAATTLTVIPQVDALGHEIPPYCGWRWAVVFAMGFLAWGFNQIFSDWCDRKEDAINAPHRPMVTGALNPAPAFAVSAVGLAAIAIIGFVLSPYTLVFLGVGGALNIAYSRLKRVPVLNCLVYAAAISCCALFGVAAIAGRLPQVSEYMNVAACVLPVHFLMCHNSYYKDVVGDRMAGVRTLQTLCPSVAYVVSIVLTVTLVALHGLVWAVSISMGAWCLGTSVQLLLTALLSIALYVALRKNRLHLVTSLNCQLCVAFLCFQPSREAWPLLLTVGSLIAINLLFLWYRDEKE